MSTSHDRPHEGAQGKRLSRGAYPLTDSFGSKAVPKFASRKRNTNPKYGFHSGPMKAPSGRLAKRAGAPNRGSGHEHRALLAILLFAFAIPAHAQCAPAPAHCITLNWTAPVGVSTPTYNVYALVGACPTTLPATVAAATTAGFVKLNSSPVTLTTFADNGAPPPLPDGATHCDFVTTVTSLGESTPSNFSQGTVPSTFAASPVPPPTGLTSTGK